MVKSFAVLGFSLASIFVSNTAQADWQLNNDKSKVSFVSIKNSSIAEVHHFNTVSGSLSEQGNFSVNIDLASVETMIPIRNQRMTEFVFETVKFPKASLHADLSKKLPQLTAGQHTLKAIKATLNFHGQQKQISTDVLVHVAQDGGITVSSLSPLIINAADFSLTEGIATLQKLAGLSSIATSVPVSYSLTLEKAQ